METLKAQLGNYYQSKRSKTKEDGIPDWSNFQVSHEIEKAMDEFVANNPGADPNLIKAKLHETIAEKFEPMIFSRSPFYYEMGVKHAFNWGTPHQFNAGSWMFRKYEHLFQDNNPEKFRLLDTRAKRGIDWFSSCVDSDHHSVGYTKVLEKGISGIIADAIGYRKKCQNDAERNFIDAAIRSMNAVIKISTKFSEKAKQMLKAADTDDGEKNLSMIAETAERVPENPPKSFYEGLAALWFLREVTGSLEGIGISILGHPDRVLYKLYKDDIENGKITRSEAVKLAGIWMLPTDIKFDLENSIWPETSTTLTLGGCDSMGKTVFN